MMDYKHMGVEDIKLRLLSADDFKIDNLIIPQYTIEEIKQYGYTNYMSNLQWLTLTVDDFIKSVMDLEMQMMLKAEEKNLKPFDFYTKITGSQEMLDSLLIAIGMVFKTEDVRYLEDEGIVAIDFIKNGILKEENGNLIPNNETLEDISEDSIKVIHRDNFDEIIELVKTINYLKPPSSPKVENPADESTRKLMEQMEKNRKKIEEIERREKQEDGQDDKVDIADIISAVTVKSNSINKFNVWDLSIYQLYDEYARLELIDNYDFSIRAMMAGAEKIDIIHWSNRLQ